MVDHESGTWYVKRGKRVSRAYESSWDRTLELIGTYDCICKKGEDKGIIIINPKVIKAVKFFYSNYSTDKETRNIFSGLVATLKVTLLTC